jgi:2-amino-4-hydroxy-6-hydroxymethyldihydropteridine diphosphokinase
MMMSFFIATGTNLGDRAENLKNAKNILCSHFILVAESRIYESPAVDFTKQPDFYNQVLEFHIPSMAPEDCMAFLLEIEKQMGRKRDVPRGPRVIDLDMLFWSDVKIKTPELEIPHPRLFERSFVILPLSELPGFNRLQQKFSFTFSFPNSASPLIIK